MKATLFVLGTIIGGLMSALLLVGGFSSAAAREGSPEVEPPLEQAATQPDLANSGTIPNDVLVHAVGDDPLVLDPAYSYSSNDSQVLQQVYDTLLGLKREKVEEFTPLLATGWTVSPDGRDYTFNIRQGVKFHNGAALTPADVAYTFQRGVLQGGSSSPQSLLTEPLFGVGTYDVCDLIDLSVCNSRSALQAYQATHAAQVAAVCTDLKSKIVADDANWTVTFHLNQAWGPFLHTLAGAWGSIIDRDWAVQQGTWDGNCNTWQNYYVVTNATSPLRNVTNGTGPFKLDHWTTNVEVVLKRYAGYWNLTPLWEGGPFGPAAFETVEMDVVPLEADRAAMLLSGQADLIDSVAVSTTEMDAATLFHYTHPAGITPTLVYTDGVIKKYTGGLASSARDAFFNYSITTGGPRNYVGSGAWDGNGIPANFFNDIHVRKGFSYAFDWDTYNNDVYGGSAIQRSGPIIKPLPGYNDSQLKYSHNATQALNELNAAHGGEVLAHGFTFTITYSTSNLSDKRVAEILKANIESLDPRFHINAAAISSSQYGSDQQNSRMPIIINGWNQDYPHPHNWVLPYLVSIYSDRANLPSGMKSAYQTMINTCISLSGSAAQTCYEGIQGQTYTDATYLFLLQSLQRRYISANVHGYYLNPGLPGPRYYDLYKSPLPQSVTAEPGVEQSLNFTPTPGVSAELTIPDDAVAEEMQIVAVPDIPVFNNQPEFILGDISFNLEAYLPDGTQIADPTFQNPITVTIAYGAGVFSPEQEASLSLLYWNGSDWEDAACGAYGRDLTNHVLAAPICHLSDFSLGEPGQVIFLPVMLK